MKLYRIESTVDNLNEPLYRTLSINKKLCQRLQ
jgi:hypothetical protein